MQTKKVDTKNKFISWFDTETGFYARTGVLDINGKDTGVDPFMASYPELIDVGIMGHCTHGIFGLCRKAGIECYQNGLSVKKPNMSLADFTSIAEQSKGKVNQIALGGRGDPNKHEDFAGICQVCRDNNIVPNYTTSGLGLTEQEVEWTKDFCGAVAVSWYRQEHTMRAINMFIEAGCTTNIHYVLGNNTIDEAIERLENNDFPEGIGAIIFLLHKPVGLGSQDNVLQTDNPRLNKFFSLVEVEHPFDIGFDSCTIPGIINYTKKIDPASVDTCEGSRFSMYISSDMVALPCSFDQEQRWGVDLKQHSIQETWDGDVFEDFRSSLRNSCPSCPNRSNCMGGCPIKKEVVLCDREEKE